MSFKDPQKLWDTVESLLDSDRTRAENRAKINAVFNGNAPFTKKEQDENSVFTNVNFLEGSRIIQSARAQAENAFLKAENFFSVTLDWGPEEKRRGWAKTITKHINKRMKRSPRYHHALDSQCAAVVLHGIAPVVWFRQRDWCPKAMGTEDVLVPTNTTNDLDNLDYFAVYQTLTPAQLMRMTYGETVDKGWNMALVNEVLKKLTSEVGNPGHTETETWDFPEKVQEEIKQNGGYWGSDAVQVVRCYDFYYKDYDEKKSTPWRRKLVLDRTNDTYGFGKEKGGILYDGKEKDYGTDIAQIMHVQFADGSVVPPFRWHSVRSLGFQLYAVAHLQNRQRCKLNDAIWESMMWYFRNAASGDQERLEKVDLHNLGIIPEGLSWVPSSERHQIDYNLVSAAIQQNRQLMQEGAASYVRDVDMDPQGEPETATGIMARVNASSQLIGSMLNRMYVYATYQFREICRRFTVLDHEDCKKFRECCERDGVPREVFQHFEDYWDIIPERVLGNGNKMLEIAQADRLMAARSAYDPHAQRTILHMYTEANTDDPLLAGQLVPLDGDDEPSKGVEKATLAWGTLIDGKPVVISEGFERTDFIETLLKLLSADIQRINQEGGVADMQRIRGLANVIKHIEEQIAIVAEDQAQGQKVKIYKDVLGKAANEVKAFAQRLQEQMEAEAQSQQGPDPETLAKIQGEMAMLQAKLAAMQATTAQKLQLTQRKFQADEGRKNQKLAGDEKRKNIVLIGDQRRANDEAQSEIALESVKTAAEIQLATKKAEAAENNQEEQE